MESHTNSSSRFHRIYDISDDHQRTGFGHARSYRCTFCKRGFSNAQALGGHMNIHRKDRAKLREFSTDHNLLSLDISSSAASDCTDHSLLIPNASADDGYAVPESTLENISITANPGVKDVAGDLLHQKPMFIEKASSTAGNNYNGKEGSRRKSGVEVMRSKQLKHVSSSYPSSELDLELRLGIQPEGAAVKR